MATVAFFGATGDCAGHALTDALKNGHRCSALARTPEKLKTSLKAKGVTSTEMNNLTIIQGDARDVQAVSQTLLFNGEIVDIILSSLGSFPVVKWSLTQPVVIDDGTICEDTSKILIQALEQINSSKKPLLVAISTTGIQPAGKPRDVPFAYIALYHWLLASPHQDKMEMEKTFRAANQQIGEKKPFSNFITVKPTLLMDGASRGVDKIRAGSEDAPAIGYTIRRAEVGEWIYEKLIASAPAADWLGKGVCLTA